MTGRWAKWLLAAGICGVSLGVSAQQACLMEGSMQVGRETVEIMDCMANRGVPEEEFKQTCRNLVQANASLGAKGKVTLTTSCPAKQQAVCAGLGGKPLDAYYYKRSAEDIQSGAEGCKKLDGVWQVGDSKAPAK